MEGVRGRMAGGHVGCGFVKTDACHCSHCRARRYRTVTNAPLILLHCRKPLPLFSAVVLDRVLHPPRQDLLRNQLGIEAL